MAKPKQKDTFIRTADTFEQMARDYQRIANGEKNLPAKAAIMREVAHYLACAARMRGQPVQHSGVRHYGRRAQY